MKFNETKALELIKQHRLSEKTIRVWRNREAIPDKYSGTLKTEITTSADQQQLDNLQKVLSNAKINVKALCRLAGEEVKEYIVKDWQKGKGPLKKEDLVTLKKAINTIRIELKQVLSEFEKKDNSETGHKLFKKFYQRDEIIWLNFFDRNKEFYNKLAGWNMGRRSFPVDEVKKLKGMMLVFLAETTI